AADYQRRTDPAHRGSRQHGCPRLAQRGKKRMSPQHLLSLDDLGAAGIRSLIDDAIKLKRTPRNEQLQRLAGHTLAMLFEKASTRTRVSFEAGMTQLGGHAIFLSPADTQIGRGESVEDTARVISGMADAVM